MRRLAALVLLVLVGAGCDKFLPLHSSAQPHDLAEPRDGGSQDGPGVVREAGPICVTSPCYECEPVTTGCKDMSCAGDRDCDGLPDARDPWADTCNALLFNGSFVSPLDQDWPSGNAASEPSCGRLRLEPGSGTTASLATQKLQTSVLVEVRLNKLDPRCKECRFALDLSANNPEHGKDTEYRRCMVSSDGTGGWLLASEVHSDVENTVQQPFGASGGLPLLLEGCS
jgi:hypothetical protein